MRSRGICFRAWVELRGFWATVFPFISIRLLDGGIFSFFCALVRCGVVLFGFVEFRIKLVLLSLSGHLRQRRSCLELKLQWGDVIFVGFYERISAMRGRFL